VNLDTNEESVKNLKKQVSSLKRQVRFCNDEISHLVTEKTQLEIENELLKTKYKTQIEIIEYLRVVLRLDPLLLGKEIQKSIERCSSFSYVSGQGKSNG
jgi:hypothetical protein